MATMHDVTERKQADDDLRRSERRLRLAQKGAQVGIWELDLRTNTSYWSPECEQLYGVEKGTLKSNDDWRTRVFSEDLLLIDAQWDSTIARGAPFEVEFRMRLDSGETRWLVSKGRAQYDASGVPVRLSGINLDITERKLNEEKLRTLSAAVEQSPASVVITDLDASILYVNPKFTEVTGYAAAEAIGHNPRILQSGLTAMDTFEQLWGQLTLGHSWHGELINKRKDGTLYFEEAHVAPVKGLSGAVSHYVAVKTDITERKRVEASLLESETRFRGVFDSVGEAIFIHDAETGAILQVNRRMGEMYGVTLEEALQLGPDDLSSGIPPYSRTEAMAYMKKAATEGVQIFEWLARRHRDGMLFWVEVNLRSVQLGGRDCLIAVARDISLEKEARRALDNQQAHLEELVFSRTTELAAARDAAEAANRAKSVFLANMSHELRTPMNGIMGMTDLVLRRATDPLQIDWLNKSKMSAQHLLAVINDILDISNIEADRIVLKESNFSLPQAVASAIHMLEAQAQAKGLSLSCEIDTNLPDLLCGDVRRLEQIVINYVGNAVKFSERGHITVHAYAVEEDRHSVLVRIDVSDQGIGISPEHQTRLFKAFTQADGSMTRRYGGTGLGLVLAKRIALLMGGNAGVISEEGIGSTFWITARLRRAITDAHAGSDPSVETAQEALARQFSGVRVLVAEDEPVNREGIMFLLKDAGLVVDVAEDGQSAVERATGGSYALILMDLQMPIMSGLEAARTIRQLPGMAAIPILALTANAFDEDREQCLEAGMDDHIGKPVRPDALCAIVLHWLHRSETRTRS